ncbi:MAG: hypothetical protein IT374_14100 [Polyangiaceae bacterium]|nr:hypothetical protein [Polyangiaceae bacterium]
MLKKRALVVESALAAAWLAACASTPDDLQHPGVSDRPREAASPRESVPPPASSAPWEHAAALPALASIDDRVLPSRGHNPPFWSGHVKVNDALLATYRALGPESAVQVGAIAVEAHKDSEGRPGPTYAMVKREAGFDTAGGDWEYLVLDGAGQVEQRGVIPLCARCHADAAVDHLFGPRVATRKKLGNAGDGKVDSAGTDDEPAAEEVPSGKLPVRAPTKKRRR